MWGDEDISPLWYYIFNSSLTMRKIADKPKLRDILQNIWKAVLKTVKDEKQTKKLSQTRGDITSKSNVVSSVGSEKKRH